MCCLRLAATTMSAIKGNDGPDNYSQEQKEISLNRVKDRAVMLWDVRDITQKIHKSSRVNIDFDYPTLIRWSPDNTAFIISKYNGGLEVHKVEKKKDGSLACSGKVLEHPQRHADDIIGMGIPVTGKYLMTCSNKTDLLISDLKGAELATIDTYLMSTACAKVSPCGRFIVATGFAPDVKVWEVLFTRTGEFQEVKRVFELTGHNSGVHDVAFDQDTSHMATISKSGTWHIYDTKIDYKRGEAPRQKISGTYEQFSPPPKIALSPNAEVLAVASANNLAFYSTIDGKLDHTIEDIYLGNITSVIFDSLGKYVLTSGDKHIRVFHNVTGYRCNIVSAQEKLKQHPSSATKERLQKLIEESEAFLKSIPEN